MYSTGANYVTSKTWSQRFKELVICHLCLAVTFLTTGIVVDLAQALLYVTVRNVSPSLYRKINYYLTYTLNSRKNFQFTGVETLFPLQNEDDYCINQSFPCVSFRNCIFG